MTRPVSDVLLLVLLVRPSIAVFQVGKRPNLCWSLVASPGSGVLTPLTSRNEKGTGILSVADRGDNQMLKSGPLPACLQELHAPLFISFGP